MLRLPEIYEGIYRDGMGAETIMISNDFCTLVMEIDGVVFSGSDFDELSVDDRSKYTAQQLARFTFLTIPVFQSGNSLATLCNCTFESAVPQIVIDKLNNFEFSCDLKIVVALGNAREGHASGGIEFETVTLSLSIAGVTYTGTSENFEISFDRIRDQIMERYQLKNCYGCLYGDYSVYGQGAFGTMLCFKNQKMEYSKVTNKDDYLALTAPFRYVQEIFSCDEYEIRKNGVGYRG